MVKKENFGKSSYVTAASKDIDFDRPNNTTMQNLLNRNTNYFSKNPREGVPQTKVSFYEMTFSFMSK